MRIIDRFIGQHNARFLVARRAEDLHLSHRTSRLQIVRYRYFSINASNALLPGHSASYGTFTSGDAGSFQHHLYGRG